MSSRGKRQAGSGRELIEYRHSYHCFLATFLPKYLPPPSNVPPPVIPKAATLTSGKKVEVDLRTLGLDPAKWKTQDHYLLLGLQDKRHLATDTEIKSSYRRQCLLYHPDKLQQAGNGGKKSEVDDKIFKCLFHAHQILSDAEKRKLYDSVDSNAFDDSIPDECDCPPGDIDRFLEVYRPVFIANARFSRRKGAPDLGHAFSPREDVEAFYSFWSNFESWRTFEYLDEDENDSAENRADKRWMDKKNKANRQKRKNEDNARLRKLFEQAYKTDPRMIRYREDERLRKEVVKMEKGMASLRVQQEKERVAREAQQRAEEEKQKKIEKEQALKQAKSAVEAEIKKERKALKKMVFDNMYFVSDQKNVGLISARAITFEKFLLKCESLKVAREIMEARLAAKEDVFQWVEDEWNRLEELAINRVPQVEKISISLATSESKPATQQTPWSLPETDVLINAIKTHPGGLRDRWQKIAEWYNRHVSHMDKHLPQRGIDELIKRANEMKQSTEEGQAAGTVPSEAQTDYKSFQKKRDPRVDLSEPTVVVERAGPGDAAAVANIAPLPKAPVEVTWTVDEVKKLEGGLKLCKADDPGRWDKIASLVGKSKKDCMLKAKEIALALKQKKSSS